MYKQVAFHGCLNERTGYGIHASRFTEQLSKLIPVNFDGQGDVHISMYDSVSIQNVNERLPYPSIVYNAWESTEQPQWFMDKMKFFDQLWVVSEWQRAASIAQGIPEEFVKVVPEGVNPDIYKPESIIVHPDGEFFNPDTFNFLHVGQWQPRKSTLEICQSFLKAFPKNKNVRLYLSADTLFPSDTYKSTEERLIAYGLQDPRIIPIHFEERDAYIRRLQSAHCFVTCARSEGWNLPLCEAMACGVVAITSDFGGSTEYAGDAINVKIRELRKPEGIYGGWDVPGQWAEPDYDDLVSKMKDAYKNYSTHKAKALTASDTIRTKFSWAAAAKKAYDIIQAIPVTIPVTNTVAKVEQVTESPEQSIAKFARSKGYEITSMKKRRVIFTVDTHPDSQPKMDTLIETLTQIKSFGYPVIVTSHFPLSTEAISLCDYYIYDKVDPVSPPDDMPTYWRQCPDGRTETVKASIPCHALAAVTNVRNALDFCLGKYDWIYNMSSDTEVDLGAWLDKVNASDKLMICQRWEDQEGTVSGQVFATKIEFMDVMFPRYANWDEFVLDYGEDRFCGERKFYKDVAKYIGLENVEWLHMDLGNRFDQVDRDAWKDDQFHCHFIEGPFLHIVGLSDRQYEVTYSNPIDGNEYTLIQKPGVWSRPSKKFYRDWTTTAKLNGEVKFIHHMDLKDKNVIISMGSKALGDTLAWIPYVEEFRKKHGCNVYCSTWWNDIMDYPEIHFIKPGDVVESVYASYEVGCFDNQLDKNVADWRQTPLQKVSADILGIDYAPIPAKLKVSPRKSGNGKQPKPYICFSEFSTMQNKMWNRPGAWQKTIDYLISLGYDCVSISTEPSVLTGIINHNGQPIEQTLTDVSGAAFYVGLNAGPTWIAYSLGIPTVLITGVSEEWNDFPNPYRIAINNEVCGVGCFNDPSMPISRDWAWCPRKKDYACTREITETMVICQIDKLREDMLCQSPLRKKAGSTKSARPMRSMLKALPLKKRSHKKGSSMRLTMGGSLPRVTA